MNRNNLNMILIRSRGMFTISSTSIALHLQFFFAHSVNIKWQTTLIKINKGEKSQVNIIDARVHSLHLLNENNAFHIVFAVPIDGIGHLGLC